MNITNKELKNRLRPFLKLQTFENTLSMKSIYIKAGKTEDVFNDLKDSFDGILMRNDDEYYLGVQNGFAKGNIRGTTFSNHMTYIEFDMFFHQNTRLSMELSPASLIFFFYCSQGVFQHSFGEQGERKSLTRQHSGILKTTPGINSILYFQKWISVKFSIIGIAANTTADASNNQLLQRLRATFLNTKEVYLMIGFQNAKITEKIKELHTITQKEAARNVLKKDILEDILKLETEQHTDKIEALILLGNSFINDRVHKIKKVSNFFVNIYAEMFTADFLMRKTEALMHAIQEGFKLISNRIAHDFLVFIKSERQKI